jgi:hypothetical protein
MNIIFNSLPMQLLVKCSNHRDTLIKINNCVKSNQYQSENVLSEIENANILFLDQGSVKHQESPDLKVGEKSKENLVENPQRDLQKLCAEAINQFFSLEVLIKDVMNYINSFQNPAYAMPSQSFPTQMFNIPNIQAQSSSPEYYLQNFYLNPSSEIQLNSTEPKKENAALISPTNPPIIKEEQKEESEQSTDLPAENPKNSHLSSQKINSDAEFLANLARAKQENATKIKENTDQKKPSQNHPKTPEHPKNPPKPKPISKKRKKERNLTEAYKQRNIAKSVLKYIFKCYMKEKNQREIPFYNQELVNNANEFMAQIAKYVQVQTGKGVKSDFQHHLNSLIQECEVNSYLLVTSGLAMEKAIAQMQNGHFSSTIKKENQKHYLLLYTMYRDSFRKLIQLKGIH